jgi:hypothetical protein
VANKQSFTPEEWTKILESTMLAGMAVTAAEPSGLWGTTSANCAAVLSKAIIACKQEPCHTRFEAFHGQGQ